MKKEFIFPKKAFEIIAEMKSDREKLDALSHIIRYGLECGDSLETYAELERLIDRANSAERRNRPTLEDYSEIIGRLNERCGAKYHAGSRKTRELISARFGEGFSRGDFLTMIDFKCSEWLGNEKMRGYLRPETLFGAKFEGYLNQARIAEKNAKTAESSFDTDKFYEAALMRAYEKNATY